MVAGRSWHWKYCPREQALGPAAQGFAAYKAGQWGEARRHLEECKWARQDAEGTPLQDGPSTTLLDYMAHSTSPPRSPGRATASSHEK